MSEHADAAEPFQPVNDLEKALAAASANAGSRPAFYRTLLASPVFALGTTGHAPGTEIVTDSKTRMSLVALRETDEEGKEQRVLFPAFTSAPRIQAFKPGGAPFVAMPAKAFLELVRKAKAGAILNPGSTCGKVLAKPEIEALLSGSLLALPESTGWKPGNELLLAAPEREPKKLCDALRSCLATHPGVSAGYVGKLPQDPVSGAPARFVIGIEADAKGSKEALRDVALVLRNVLPPTQQADLLALGETEASAQMRAKGLRFFER